MNPTEAWARERERLRSAPRIRPANIVVPGPGQESVWDYPRPPRVEAVGSRVRVVLAGTVIADTMAALRVCETSSPPAYYIPPADVNLRCVERSARTAFCEWKGIASYWSLRVGERFARDAAWSYPAPDAGYERIRDYLAFLPRRMDACYVGEYRAAPQPGLYYGGWITPELVGPFKGGPGSEGW